MTDIEKQLCQSEREPDRPNLVERTHLPGIFFPRDSTEDELKSLPHVVDRIPLRAWIVIIAAASERFTYFGVMAPWRWFPRYHALRDSFSD